MLFIKGILIFVLVVISFVLIGLVLMQKSKSGGGLGGAFGGGMTESILGSRAGNFLSQATTYLGIAFAVITLAIGMIDSRQGTTPGFAPPPPAPAAPAAPTPNTPAPTP